jgi:uncharacterized protein YbjT (DUF2867 family)
METRRVATVFGGSGFIGRYVVKRLAQQGYIVRVPSRDPEGALFLKPMGMVGQIVPLYASVTDEATVRRAVEGAEVVVNLVGVLTESRQAPFQAIHAEGSERIARLSAAAGVGRLVQISAIGADPASPSRYASTKGKAEQAVLAAFPRAVILRPSLVFGLEDQFFNRFAAIARVAPFMPVIAGDAKMQPVFVSDVADAVMAALGSSAAQGKIFEIGGPRVWTFREILAFILKTTKRHRMLVDVPMGIARLQASVLQHIPGKPLTPDQLLMLSKDNIVSPNALGVADLGIVPTPAELVVPGYLNRYQPGGGRRPTALLPLGG